MVVKCCNTAVTSLLSSLEGITPQSLEPQPGTALPGCSTRKESAAARKLRSTAPQRGSGHCPFSV
jgi:hypothetical protein